MRKAMVLAIGLTCSVLLAFSTANAGVGPECAVCTCQGGGVQDTIICVNTQMEELEELGPCGSACSSIYQSYKSIEIVEAACEDLPACDHAETPAASPLWLGSGAVALLLLGGATLRRLRLRTARS